MPKENGFPNDKFPSDKIIARADGFYQASSGMLKSEDLLQLAQISRKVKNEQQGNRLKVVAVEIAHDVEIKGLLGTDVFDVSVSILDSVGAFCTPSVVV